MVVPVKRVEYVAMATPAGFCLEDVLAKSTRFRSLAPAEGERVLGDI